ncbi:MAG TPA: YiiX/YebB-like N1pC/P60 family cysteine hydrolase [Prolixibacteraceae bacterium]|nr:YiiX/YebB-like N1pC/P60 family cysteine hydrolase [Prolixibacteraceae bacterium]
MNKWKLTVFFLTFIGLFACKPSTSRIELHSGDILFQGNYSGHLSNAIDKVTQTSAQTHFSHMGLVEVTDSGVFVLHASPVGGTCVVSLNEFLHPEGDSVSVVAYRLNEQWQEVIPSALSNARQLLGKPYNFSYILSDTAHYCSEFVYLAFADDSVFKLEPMTFKDPQTGDFSPAWVKYYQEKGLEIPEGLPGCNPNGMAASPKLERLGKLN